MSDARGEIRKIRRIVDVGDLAVYLEILVKDLRIGLRVVRSPALLGRTGPGPGCDFGQPSRGALQSFQSALQVNLDVLRWTRHDSNSVKSVGDLRLYMSSIPNARLREEARQR